MRASGLNRAFQVSADKSVKSTLSASGCTAQSSSSSSSVASKPVFGCDPLSSIIPVNPSAALRLQKCLQNACRAVCRGSISRSKISSHWQFRYRSDIERFIHDLSKSDVPANARPQCRPSLLAQADMLPGNISSLPQIQTRARHLGC